MLSSIIFYRLVVVRGIVQVWNASACNCEKKAGQLFFRFKKINDQFLSGQTSKTEHKDKSFGKVTTNDQQTTVVKRNSCQRKNSKMVKIAFPYTVDDGTFRRRVASRVAARCVDIRDEAAAAVRFKASYNYHESCFVSFIITVVLIAASIHHSLIYTLLCVARWLFLFWCCLSFRLDLLMNSLIIQFDSSCFFFLFLFCYFVIHNIWNRIQ